MTKMYTLGLLLITANLAVASDNASANFTKTKMINASKSISHKFEQTTTSILILYSLIEPNTITSACIQGTFINRTYFTGKYRASRCNRATGIREFLPNADTHFKNLQALYGQTPETPTTIPEEEEEEPATASETPIEKKAVEKKQGEQ